MTPPRLRVLLSDASVQPVILDKVRIIEVPTGSRRVSSFLDAQIYHRPLHDVNRAPLNTRMGVADLLQTSPPFRTGWVIG